MTKPTMTNQTANTEAGQIPEAPIYWDNRQAAAWREGYESGRSAAIAALADALAAFQKVNLKGTNENQP